MTATYMLLMLSAILATALAVLLACASRIHRLHRRLEDEQDRRQTTERSLEAVTQDARLYERMLSQMVDGGNVSILADREGSVRHLTLGITDERDAVPQDIDETRMSEEIWDKEKTR